MRALLNWWASVVSHERGHLLLDIGLLILRLTAGGILLLVHLLPKIHGKMVPLPDSLYLGDPKGWMVYLMAVSAIFVVLGFATRIASIILVLCMAYVVWVLHGADVSATKEIAILYLGAFLALVFVSAGRFSIDRTIVPVRI